jgi:hypothetical protein
MIPQKSIVKQLLKEGRGVFIVFFGPTNFLKMSLRFEKYSDDIFVTDFYFL